MAGPPRQPPTPLRPTDDRLARFGWLLGLIGLSVTFNMAAPAARWGEAVALVLQAGVLILALHAVEAAPRLQRLALVSAGAVAVLGAAGLLLDGAGGLQLGGGDGQRFGVALAAGLGVVLVAATIAAIIDHLRSAGALTGRTVLGALCVYLLIGSLFTFAYTVLAAGGSDAFFADGEPVTPASLEYFSFTTLTTVGYGDLTPATRAGRALAMAEALIGQIYLVTVVALVVGNLSLPSSRAPQPPTDPEEQP